MSAARIAYQRDCLAAHIAETEEILAQRARGLETRIAILEALDQTFARADHAAAASALGAAVRDYPKRGA